MSLGPTKWIPHSVQDIGTIEVTVDDWTTPLCIADITEAVHAFNIDPHALKEGDYELFENLVRAYRVMVAVSLRGFFPTDFLEIAKALARAPETLTEFSALRALGADVVSLQQVLFAGAYGPPMRRTGALVARIRIQAAGLDSREMWHEIKYGPKRAVRCDCGGEVWDRPAEDYEGGACTHIRALYRGEVTEDKRVAARTPTEGLYKGGMLSPETSPNRPWLVQLTALGEEMFRHRWAIRKLGGSS